MSAPPFAYCLLDDYLDDETRSELLAIALRRWNSGSVTYQPCGKRGYFNLNTGHPKFSKRFDTVVGNIFASAGISAAHYVPSRHFIGINLPTASVTPHTDEIQFADIRHLSDPVEVRINTFLQRPESGGVPVIGDDLVNIPLGRALAFDAAITHATTPVEGDTIRVVLSISAAVERRECQKLRTTTPNHVGELKHD